jgi:hypothetical protein
MESTAVVAISVLTMKFISVCEGRYLLHEQSVTKGMFT